MFNRLAGMTGAVLVAAALTPLASHAASITPDRFAATIDVGETVTIDKTVALDSAGPAVSKLDVFFLVDNTGSMGSVINSVRSNASTILSAMTGADPRFTGADVAFGVGRYFGDPGEFAPVDPGAAYDLLQPITTNQADIETAINAWVATGGGDRPEGNFFALHQVATEGGPTDGIGSTDTGAGTGEVTGWRDGAARVVVWFGDAPSHPFGSGDAENTVDLDEAIAALNAENVTVAAINRFGAGAGIDDNGQASDIAAATGGTLTNGISGASSATTIDAILNAVGDATSNIDLSFSAIGDTSGVDVAFACTDPLGCDSVGSGESRSFKVDITGLTPGLFEFEVVADGIAGAVEFDSITVADGSGGQSSRATNVSEPGTLALMAFGLIGLAGAIRRRSRH